MFHGHIATSSNQKKYQHTVTSLVDGQHCRCGVTLKRTECGIKV